MNPDTGTSGHFFSISDRSCLLDVLPAKVPHQVFLPDGSSVFSTHTARLNLPNLPSQATIVHVFPHWIGSLLSIGLLCDAGCTAKFTADGVTITDSSDTVILHGHRSQLTRMWTINLTPPPSISAVVITEPQGTQANVVDFYHAAMGSPAPSTFLAALKKKYIDFPGLTLEIATKYMPNSVATSKGHMDQFRQGHRSTQAPLEDELDLDLHPIPVPRTRTRLPIQSKIIPVSDIRYTDPTGAFPVRGLQGAQYILVMLCANYIHLETMKSKEGPEYVRAYAAGTDYFQARGIVPNYERLDNETSKLLVKYCANHQPPLTIQYVPPYEHRANKAERAIRTVKNHLIATLCAVNKTFPLSAWELLLPQVELTLNLMRSSAFSPNTSAHQALNGPYVFTHNPIAPPGMAVVAFVDPGKRSTFAPHGDDGFYVGPALQHHRCYTVYIPSTNESRIVGQLSWHPTSEVHMPGHTPLEELIHGVKQLGQALRNVASTHPELLTDSSPLSGARSELLCSLDALHDVFPRPPVIVDSPSVQPDLSQSLRVEPASEHSALLMVEPASDHYAPLRVAPFDPHQVPSASPRVHEPIRTPVPLTPTVPVPPLATIYPVTPFTLDFTDAASATLSQLPINHSQTSSVPCSVFGISPIPEQMVLEDAPTDDLWAQVFTAALDHAREEDLAAERASFGLVNSVMQKDAFAMDQFNQPFELQVCKIWSGQHSMDYCRE